MNDDALLDLLRRSAAAPDEAPDSAFVDALEQRLLTAPAGGTVVPMARRRRRLGRTGAIAVIAVAGLAGAAAAAGVVPNPFSEEAATPAASTAPPGAPPATEGTAAGTLPPSSDAPAVPPVPPPTRPPATTIPVATTTAPAPPTTAPAITAPPATQPPAPTTEVPVPVTMTLTCTPDGTRVQSAWSAPATALDHYVVLRSGGGAGRAYTLPVGTTNWTDTTAVPGVHYTYLVHAMDAQDHSLGRSTVVPVDCCAAG